MRVIDFADELAQLTPLRSRSPQTSKQEAATAFANLGSFSNGAAFCGSFDGQSAWERHPGDELVQVLKGETELTILTDDEDYHFTLAAGQMIVVPSGCWHRFDSSGVSLMTISPQPTEHSSDADPRLRA